MDNTLRKDITDTVATWRDERQGLYPELDKLSNNLEQVHKYAAQFVLGGTSSRMTGAFLEAGGGVYGCDALEVIGLGLKVVGGGVRTGAELYKLKSDLTAVRSAEKMILEHQATHDHLKGLARRALCVLPSLDYRTLYETDANAFSAAAQMIEAAKAFRDALHTNNGDRENGESGDQDKGETPETSSQMTRWQQAGTILRALDGIIQKDIPLLFDSWETLQGRRVPETVQRLRWLKNDLRINEDQLMINLEQMIQRLIVMG